MEDSIDSKLQSLILIEKIFKITDFSDWKVDTTETTNQQKVNKCMLKYQTITEVKSKIINNFTLEVTKIRAFIMLS